MKSKMENGHCVLFLGNIFNGREAEPLVSLFRSKIQAGTKSFVVDASDLSAIDSMGIGILVRMLKEARAGGGDVQLRNLKGHPFKIFKQARLDWVFTIQSGDETYTPRQDLIPYIDTLSLVMQYESYSDIGVFHLSGMMCYPHGPQQFKEEVLLKLAEKTKILLAFNKLLFLDVHSINEILNIYFILKTTGGDLGFCGATGLTGEILRTFGVHALLIEFESLQKALVEWDVRDASDQKGT